MVLPSHAGNGVAEATLAMVQCCYRDNLVVARCRCRVMLAIVLSSHVGDCVVEVTRPRHDVDAESCWRRRCRVMLVMVLSR
jgi:hypothetical protein